MITKNHSISKFHTLAFLIAISLLLFTQQVGAGTSTLSKSNFLSGVTAYAKVAANPGYSGSGNCSIKSYTSPSTTINIIGWTWWQCDVLQNGIVVGSMSLGGRAITSSSTLQSATYLYAFYYGNSIKAHGVHDFNHTGSNPSPWRPYNSKSYP